MSEQERIPDEWIGQEVLISVLQPGGYDLRTYARLTLTGSWRRGDLEAVNDSGIVGTFADNSNEPDEPRERIFYSWGGLISAQPTGP